jgi:hypothetical protein
MERKTVAAWRHSVAAGKICLMADICRFHEQTAQKAVGWRGISSGALFPLARCRAIRWRRRQDHHDPHDEFT